MAAPTPPAFDTLALHSGQRPDPVNGARAVPIYETTSYVYRDTDHAAALFNLERAGHIYSRISNPTVAVLEERLAALEGGVGAVATASGMAALHLAIATLASAGDHIVASSALYGGTVNLLARTLPRFGVTTTFVAPRDHAGFAAAIRPETRLVLAETIGNPNLEVLDIAAVAGVAHAAGVPLLIDNTFATPYLCRPIEHGADIVMHSLTKWIGGHGRVLGGVLVDAGRFDWRGSGRHATLIEPYDGYHGLNFADDFGPAAFVMRARVEGLRDFGAGAAGRERRDHPARGRDARAADGPACRQCAGGRRGAPRARGGRLGHAIRRSPIIPTPSWRGGCMPRGAGSIVTFGVRGGREAATRFIESAEAREPPRQCRRRQDAGHPSRLDHPCAARRRGARRRRASARTWSGCRSGSRTPPTSSPISNRR